MIDTVVFDLDGTLRDWEPGIAQALAALRPEVPEQHRDGLEARLAETTERLLITRRDGRVVDRQHYMYWYQPLSMWQEVLPGAEPEVQEQLASRFAELLDAVPFADVHPVLEQLRPAAPWTRSESRPAKRCSGARVSRRFAATTCSSAEPIWRGTTRVG